MAFDMEEIAEEFSNASTKGREWFASDAYSTRRLAKANRDMDALVNLLRCRKWRRANPERARAICQAYRERHRERIRERNRQKFQATKAEPRRRAKRLAALRDYRERIRASPERYAAEASRNRERCRANYLRRKANAEAWARLQERGKQAYAAVKANADAYAKRKKAWRDAGRRRRERLKRDASQRGDA